MNDINHITQHCEQDDIICAVVNAEEEDCDATPAKDATPPNFYVGVNDKGLEFVSNDTIVLLHMYILLNV